MVSNEAKGNATETLLAERWAVYASLLSRLLESDPVGMGAGFSGRIPNGGGIYRIIETGSDVKETVYVGKTGNFFERLYRNHLQGNMKASTLKRKMIERGDFASPNDVKAYFRGACAVQFLSLEDEELRHWLEHSAIAMLRPRYN